MHPLYINFSQPILFTVLKQQHSIFFKKTEPEICLTYPIYFVGVDLFNIRTEHDIYFNLSIYIQLIVANKTYIHSMHK